MQRLISYSYQGLKQWGVMTTDGTGIYSALKLEETYFIPLAETIEEFIRFGEEGLLNLAKMLEMNKKDQSVIPIPVSQVQIEIPFYPQRNIFCVGKNFEKHAKELSLFQNTLPETPIFFTKSNTSVIGPNELIDSHVDITSKLDYEGELAVIIGKQGTDISEEEAIKHVYGYTIINDITARDLQNKQGQWFKSKSLNTFCPMGPSIMVGAWPFPFTIYTKVNGNLRQESSSSHFIFSIPKIIASLSEGMTLLPGDIIALGTPSGVGMAMNPPQFLKKGDEIEITIDPIGVLKNKVK